MRYEFFQQSFCHERGSDLLLLDGDGQLTRAGFFERTIRLLNHLVSQGLRHGDRVVVGLDNRPEYLELIVALGLGGMTACPVSPDLPIAQMKRVKKVTRAKATLTAYSQLAYSLDRSLPDCARQGGLDDPFLVVFSSGTTGAPKGIVQSLGNFFGSAAAFAEGLGLAATDLTLHNWPMFYNAGLFNLFACPLVTGGRIAVGKRFSAKDMEAFWKDVTRYRPSQVYLSPTMAAALVRTFKFFSFPPDILHGTKVISTSSILYPTIKDQFLAAFGTPLVPCFGITELGGSFTIGDAHSGPFSVGRPTGKVTLAVDSEADNELLVRTPYLALGYLNEFGAIDPFDRDADFRTGDLGKVVDGELFVSGRKKDSIKKGGELINLAEIEDLANGLGQCEECLAVGRPDVFWGEIYDFFFVPRADADPAAVKNALIRLFNDSLPQMQRPNSVAAIESIPKTGSGKPIKRLVSYEAVT